MFAFSKSWAASSMNRNRNLIQPSSTLFIRKRYPASWGLRTQETETFLLLEVMVRQENPHSLLGNSWRGGGEKSCNFPEPLQQSRSFTAGRTQPQSSTIHNSEVHSSIPHLSRNTISKWRASNYWGTKDKRKEQWFKCALFTSLHPRTCWFTDFFERGRGWGKRAWERQKKRQTVTEKHSSVVPQPWNKTPTNWATHQNCPFDNLAWLSFYIGKNIYFVFAMKSSFYHFKDSFPFWISWGFLLLVIWFFFKTIKSSIYLKFILKYNMRNIFTFIYSH